jgi:hypothetical protein
VAVEFLIHSGHTVEDGRAEAESLDNGSQLGEAAREVLYPDD